MINKLQEWCQKRDMSLPVYNITQVDGGFVSTVIMPNGVECTGDNYSNKKDAKKNSAKTAYEKLFDKEYFSNDRKLYKIRTPSKTGIFVDCENKQKFINEFFRFVDFDLGFINIYAFATDGHGSLGKILPENRKCITELTSKSSFSDTSSVFMMYNLAKFVKQYENIVIVTSNNFGSALVHCIKQNEPDKNVVCQTDIPKIVDLLNVNAADF